MDVISHAKNIPYWTLKNMELAVFACHKLFAKKQPTWDQLYMLQIMSYRDLQRGYARDDQ